MERMGWMGWDGMDGWKKEKKEGKKERKNKAMGESENIKKKKKSSAREFNALLSFFLFSRFLSYCKQTKREARGKRQTDTFDTFLRHALVHTQIHRHTTDTCSGRDVMKAHFERQHVLALPCVSFFFSCFAISVRRGQTQGKGSCQRLERKNAFSL